MKITSIKQQIKFPDRYSIYIDDEYAFSLSANELLNQQLNVGDELKKSELKDFKDISETDKAYRAVLNLLSRRSRSVWEVEQYLKLKGYKNNTIVKILNKLNKKGYLNDSEFAINWLQNRRLLKNISKRRIKQELQQKHISDKIILEVLSQDSTNEIDVIKNIINNKKNQTRYNNQQKLIAYLIRQGFAYHDVKQAIENPS